MEDPANQINKDQRLLNRVMSYLVQHKHYGSSAEYANIRAISKETGDTLEEVFNATLRLKDQGLLEEAAVDDLYSFHDKLQQVKRQHEPSPIRHNVRLSRHGEELFHREIQSSWEALHLTPRRNPNNTPSTTKTRASWIEKHWWGVVIPLIVALTAAFIAKQMGWI